MSGLRTSVTQARVLWAALLMVVLAMRVAIPCGYMPVWTAGQLAIEPCDGTGVIAAPASGVMAHHHHHDGKDKAAHRSICPYAAAAAQALPHSGMPFLEVLLLLAAALLLGRAFCFIERHRAEERPPLRGPPALALN
jgi:hypothetical protein